MEFEISLGQVIQGLDFDLGQGGEIRGHVLDTDGTPVDASVSARSADGNGGRRSSTSTDDDGSFFLAGHFKLRSQFRMGSMADNGPHFARLTRLLAHTSQTLPPGAQVL